jgi:hypothetical protein
MAIVRRLEPQVLEKDTNTEVESTYSIVHDTDGRAYLQIDTYGSKGCGCHSCILLPAYNESNNSGSMAGGVIEVVRITHRRAHCSTLSARSVFQRLARPFVSIVKNDLPG